MSDLQATSEQALVIRGDLPTPMLGVLSLPGHGTPAPTSAVVIVNGGAQYRAGAHRLFVQLARHLAAHGHAVLRFDLPGQGDSPGEPVHFEDTAPHIGTAINALHQRLPQLQQTALLGLCDGASACLLYLNAQPDPRVTRLVLLNPWVHSETVRAQAQLRHYYGQRLLMPEFWKKLLSGGVGLKALHELAQQAGRAFARPSGAERQPGFQDCMGEAWHTFGGSICLLLSDNDLTAQEFTTHACHAAAWRGWDQHPGLRIHRLPSADHTFSATKAKGEAFGHIQDWLQRTKVR